jgi:hypothetical protein
MSLNYPDGMRESDIPGFNDWEQEVAIECSGCGFKGDAELSFSPGMRRYDDCHGIGECPECGDEVEAVIEPDLPDPDYDR